MHILTPPQIRAEATQLLTDVERQITELTEIQSTATGSYADDMADLLDQALDHRRRLEQLLERTTPEEAPCSNQH